MKDLVLNGESDYIPLFYDNPLGMSRNEPFALLIFFYDFFFQLSSIVFSSILDCNCPIFIFSPHDLVRYTIVYKQPIILNKLVHHHDVMNVLIAAYENLFMLHII